jgi:uncharacterized glyoxalase superfamily protein PhnB
MPSGSRATLASGAQAPDAVGTVQMAIQETFWSPAFGMVIDRFGIPWSINCEQQPEVA